MSNFLSNDELLARYLDGVADDTDLAVLQERLVAHPELADALATLSRFELLLQAKVASAEANRHSQPQIAHTILDPESPVPNTASVFNYLGSALHGTAGFFSQGIPLSYLVATVLVGLGLWVASLIPVSHPAQLASTPSAVDPSKLQPVGQITGMVDCQWTNPKSATTELAQVTLGRNYALASGLLEITYDTGARVILQGPVTYQVESRSGGYLSVGKLTARVEKKEERRTKNEELSASSSSSLIPHSYFAVRTPTATVTDLGTEFGVSVSNEGWTQVHVLQGVVEAQTAGPDAGNRHCERLTEGQAVEIGKKGTEFDAVVFASKRFVRKVDTPTAAAPDVAYMKAVLADKPLGYWPLNEPVRAQKFLDHSGNGFHGYAMNRVMAGQAGPLFGNSRAVGFDGNGYVDVGRHDEFALVNNFTLEAWVCIGQISHQLAARMISATPYSVDDRGGRMFGWALEASRKADQNGALPPATLRLTTYGVKDYELTLPNEMASEDQWVHAAVVCDRDNTTHFYLNGTHRQSITTDKPGNSGPVWIEIGGGTINNGEFWRGRLAHLAVYRQALSLQQIENHYNQRRAP